MPRFNKVVSDQADRRGRGMATERAYQVVIGVMAARRPTCSDEYAQALRTLNSSIFAIAYSYAWGEPNESSRVELSKEAVQDSFLKMMSDGFQKYLDTFPDLPFWPYGRKITRHVCIDAFGENSRTRNRHQSYEASCADFSDPDADPSRPAELGELLRDCEELVNRLPRRLRESVYYTYWGGLPARDVADIMGTNPRTVGTWNHRARRLLAPELKRRGHWPL